MQLCLLNLTHLNEAPLVLERLWLTSLSYNRTNSQPPGITNFSHGQRLDRHKPKTNRHGPAGILVLSACTNTYHNHEEEEKDRILACQIGDTSDFGGRIMLWKGRNHYG